MTRTLLLSRRFLPLFLVQALGALNDNLFKNALVVLIAFRATPGGPALVALAGGLFILPFLLFSATAGQIADRFGKTGLIRWSKLSELLIMGAGCIALVLGSVPLLLAVLFALGVQAAFFGPLKYGILPELLHPDELLPGNALVEAGTFAAILLGTIAGGALMGWPAGAVAVGVSGLTLAAAGLAAAFAIPPGTAAAAALAIGVNPARATLELLRAARTDPPMWTAVLALSWFWALGAVFLAQFPVLAQAEFHADNRVVTLLLAGFVLGVGLGSLAAGRMRDGLRAVPVAAVALSASTWAFAGLSATPAAAGWVSPGAMLAAPSGCAALFCLLAASAAGGVYSVPLYAAIQRHAAPSARARAVAANNVVNAAFMVAAAAATAGMAAAGMRPAAILVLAGALNLGAALLLRRALRARPVAGEAALGHEGV